MFVFRILLSKLKGGSYKNKLHRMFGLLVVSEMRFYPLSGHVSVVPTKHFTRVNFASNMASFQIRKLPVIRVFQECSLAV